MLNSILLQASPGASGGMMQIIMMVGIIAVFYFFMIRPQQKKAKEQRVMIENLKEGDSVVTIGGLHGKVHSVEESTVTLTLDKGVKLTFEKSSISRKI
ncbi:MAG: preprotein translocase subunit YajC [Cytophagaceae bacterium SCN 52-12]|nr:MAG: preprotein translocase subunit YajC [Cytophagaceae bacterium SCN 52-12]